MDVFTCFHPQNKGHPFFSPHGDDFSQLGFRDPRTRGEDAIQTDGIPRMVALFQATSRYG